MLAKKALEGKLQPCPTWYEPERGAHFHREMSLKERELVPKEQRVDHSKDGDQLRVTTATGSILIIPDGRRCAEQAGDHPVELHLCTGSMRVDQTWLYLGS